MLCNEMLSLLGDKERAIVEDSNAKRKAYHDLHRCKSNPAIKVVESVEQYLDRRNAEFMAMLEA